MTITQLEYIVAVGACKSFAKAAQKCHITQPTLSMQIKKLEEELNVLLFDRTKKPIHTTAIGQQIIDQAQLSLKEFYRIQSLIDAQQDDCCGELRLGIIPTLSPYLTPLFAVEFGQRYPKIMLTVKEMLSQDIAQAINNDQLDIGILVTPFDSPGLVESPLFYEPFVAYMAANHPLADRSQVHFSDLNRGDMWLLKEGHCFRNQAINICGKNPMEENNNKLRFESGSLETLRRIVEKQYGYTLLPELAIQDFTPQQKRLVKEFSEPQPVREVSLITHRRFMKRKMVEALGETIMENIPPSLRQKDAGQVISWQESALLETT